jgi:hypothetical protein
MDDIAIFCMDSETNHAKKVKGEYRRKDRENKTKTKNNGKETENDEKMTHIYGRKIRPHKPIVSSPTTTDAQA